MITVYGPTSLTSKVKTEERLHEYGRLTEIVDRLRQESTEFKLPIPPQNLLK